MSEANNSANLYNMNKQLMANEKPLDVIAYGNLLGKIATWFEQGIQYYMLLCHEHRNYTLFNIKPNAYIGLAEKSKTASQELKECLDNRGSVLSIEYQEAQDAWEIWIKDNITAETMVYYLFKYDAGVIEV